MKTEKPDMTIRNAVKNLIGFVLIIMIVPPFFTAIVRSNTPSRESREIDAMTNRIGASLDRHRPQQAEAVAPPVSTPLVSTPPEVPTPALKTELTRAEVLEQKEALMKELEHEQSVLRGVTSICEQDLNGTAKLTLLEKRMYIEIVTNSTEKSNSIIKRLTALAPELDRVKAELPVNQQEIQ